MSPRTRVFAAVGAAAVIVAGAVVGVTWLQTRGTSANAIHPLKGIPPLRFDFGVDAGAEARALARGASLLAAGKRLQAASIFGRYSSLQAQIGAAFAKWPDLADVEKIAGRHPSSAVAQLHLGLALLWSGRNTDAAKTLRQVDAKFPDSSSAVAAEDVLYGKGTVPGLPYIVVPYSPPAERTLAAQVAVAARAARAPSERAKLIYGVMLWQLQHRLSARRQFAAAAKLAPDDPVALTAAGVAKFTKRSPVAAFATLGPLTGRFPKAAVVRFHLGLLLIWRGEVKKGLTQLRTVTTSEPDSLYAKDAHELLSRLVPNGTK